MIKVTVKECERVEPDRVYPVLMKHPNTKEIVLFKSNSKGTVIDSGEYGCHEVGSYHESWVDIKEWVRLDGVIEISNY